MSEFSTSESKKILYDAIKPYFKKENFKFISGGSPGFVKLTDFGYIDVAFTSSSHASVGLVGFVPIHLYLKEIEDIMDDISHPDRINWQIAQGMWRVTTIRDTKTDLFQYNKKLSIDTEEKTINFANSIINYMQKEGADFVKQYTYLPNILTEIDRLISIEKLMNLIICGSTDYFFRVLIIARLCNEQSLEKKLEKVESVLASDDYYKVWIPYYEKLKVKLSTLEPRYNL